MTWRDARAIDALRAEANRRWPNRSKASDGTIGDAAHATRDSDHNPWVKDGGIGVVTAIDLTDDGDIGEITVDTLVKRRDPRVKYIIHNRTIWRSYDKPGIPAWTPAPYTGLNAHLKHVHVSVKSTKALYDSIAPWGIFPFATPTKNITGFRLAKTVAERRKYAVEIVKHGSPEARAAAQRWLDEDSKETAAKTAKKKAYWDVVAQEVKS